MSCSIYNFQIIIIYLNLGLFVLSIIFVDYFLMFVYLCPVLSMCSTKLDFMFGSLMAFICSLYLVVNDLCVCPIYNLL